jgi:hypothetical protein
LANWIERITATSLTIPSLIQRGYMKKGLGGQLMETMRV